MTGAIIGDIVGSVYEWDNIKTKDFLLFSSGCFFTDDTVMTLAIAEGLMNGGSADALIQAMKKYDRIKESDDTKMIRDDANRPLSFLYLVYPSSGNGIIVFCLTYLTKFCTVPFSHYL